MGSCSANEPSLTTGRAAGDPISSGDGACRAPRSPSVFAQLPTAHEHGVRARSSHATHARPLERRLPPGSPAATIRARCRCAIRDSRLVPSAASVRIQLPPSLEDPVALLEQHPPSGQNALLSRRIRSSLWGVHALWRDGDGHRGGQQAAEAPGQPPQGDYGQAEGLVCRPSSPPISH